MGVHVDPGWDIGTPVGSTGRTIRINGHFDELVRD